MTPENKGGLMRALVADVRIDEEKGICRVELVDFDRVADTQEAA